MELNQTIQNFTVTASRPLKELEATLWQMEHKKSGARLVWLDRNEENKTFSIAFKTQPWDDTGVFHILEHSVLCGSRQFPVKEPFVELLKSSLNTFLNAMTFPDKTMYPFSTRNHQDFLNLLRVYMDAVLHPLIYEKPEIFGQEGWHYELQEQDGAGYKGVVYNEMKGAFASADSIMDYEICRGLFPDTCYRFASGGHPEHIPELSYEDFAAAHKRLYHPSNSYIFLDGDMDVEQVLKVLDQEYLSEFDAVQPPADIPFQAPSDGGTVEARYELSPEEELKGRARLALGLVACGYDSREEITAIMALSDVLSGDNQAPLTRRLLEDGLAKDMSLTVCDGVLQPYIVVEARDVDEARLDEAEAAISSELMRLHTQGLSHSRILATLDNMEFRARQRDYGAMPTGLVFAMQAMESWLYGGDPGANLCVGELFDSLRHRVEQGYFEELIDRVLINNPHRCKVIMRPSHTLGQERKDQETRRLREAESSWDQEAAERVRRRQAEIEVWQNTPDTEEALASIPMLRLDEIPKEPEKLPLEVAQESGLELLCHRMPTAGIAYLNLYFPIDALTGEELKRVGFLTKLLGSLSTGKYGLETLQELMRSLFGQLSFSVPAFSHREERDKTRVFMCVEASMLEDKLEKALDLLCEILTGTQLRDKTRMYQLLCQQRSSLFEQTVMSGDAAAQRRIMARTCAEGAINEYVGGVEYLRWLKDLEDNFDARFEGLCEELVRLSGMIFTAAGLTLGVTCQKPGIERAAAKLLKQGLPAGEPYRPANTPVRPWPPAREGIIIPADVSFAALGGSFAPAATGGAKVMGRAVSLGYLWNAVRVQGGAYGVGMALRDNGFACFSSFRDPTPGRTLGCYTASADFLEDFCGGQVDLTAMILGAVAQADPLLTPRLKGAVADIRYFRGVTHEDLCRTRQETLSASPQDILELRGQLRELYAGGSVCVLGSKGQIEDCKDKLESVSTL